MLNVTIDARNYKRYVNRPRAQRKILEIMEKHELVDVLREVFPEKSDYTWRKFKTIQQGRLEYFLISEELMPDVNGVKINLCYGSDHLLIFVELKTEGRKYGKQYKKFNNSLLKDKIYISMIKQLIIDVKKQYAVSVSNLGNIEHIPDERIKFQINDQLFFEVLLMEIQCKTISYATYKKKEEAKTEKEPVEEIQLMKAHLKPN